MTCLVMQHAYACQRVGPDEFPLGYYVYLGHIRHPDHHCEECS